MVFCPPARENASCRKGTWVGPEDTFCCVLRKSLSKVTNWHGFGKGATSVVPYESKIDGFSRWG